MREPPKLADATICSIVQTHYSLSVAALTFLPIGADSASFVYRIDATNGMRYFLKVRKAEGFSATSLLIPRFLYEHGVPHIVTPLPTTTNALWMREGDFVVTLYPFLDARTATDAGLSLQQWHALGAALRKIHESNLPVDLRQTVRQETFIPWRRNVLNDLEPVIASNDLADPAQRELSTFWHARQDDIRTLIERSDMLADQLRQASLPRVLCHADFHTWNVLLDPTQQMWIVDWDEVLFAPKERDLMFVIGGIGRGLVSAQETDSFLRGYGETAIDCRALTYYRYAWAVQEMGAYAEDVFFSPDLSEQARSDSARAFIDIFASGNIAVIACASDI